MNNEIILRDYLRVISKWKWFIALMTAIVVITSGIMSWFVLPPVYQAKAVIQVVQGEQKPAAVRDNQTLEDVVGTLSRLPQMTMNTYVNQLKNQVVFQRAINRLGLDQNQYTPSGLSGMVTAKLIKDTSLIEIQVRNTDPQLATNLANTIGEEFILIINENNQQQLGKSMEYLKNQLENTDRELAVAVENLRLFDAQPRSVEYLSKQMENLLADLSDYRSQLASARVSLHQELAGKSRLEERLTQTPDMIKTIKTLPAEATGAEQGGPNPQVVTEERPNPAYERITQELTAKEVTISELEARAEAMESTLASLEKQIEALQAEMAGKWAERDRLQGDVDRMKAAYAVLAGKLTQTQITRSINIGDSSLMVVARAVVPTDPVKPKKQQNLALAIVIGLMASISLVFLLEILDNTIKTPQDVQRHLGLPVLGNIPLVQAPGKGGAVTGRKLWLPKLDRPVEGALPYLAAEVASGEALATKE